MKSRINRYAIRKLSVGLVSVAVASFLWLTSHGHHVSAQEEKGSVTSQESSDGLQSEMSASPAVSSQVDKSEQSDNLQSSEQNTWSSISLPEGYTEEELLKNEPNLIEAGQRGLEQNSGYLPSKLDSETSLAIDNLQDKERMHLAKWLTDLINPLRAKWGHQPYQVDASLQEASQVLANRYQSQNWQANEQGFHGQWESELFSPYDSAWYQYWMPMKTNFAEAKNLGQVKGAIYQGIIGMLFESHADSYLPARYLLSVDSARSSRQPLLGLGLTRIVSRNQESQYFLTLNFLTANKVSEPKQSTDPSNPLDPSRPTEPILPIDPVVPQPPLDPISPMDPILPQPDPKPDGEEPKPLLDPNQTSPNEDETPSPLEQRPRRELPSLVEKANVMAQRTQASGESIEEKEENASVSSSQVSHSSVSSYNASVDSSEPNSSGSTEPIPSSASGDESYWLLLGGVSAVAAAAGLIYLKQVEIRRRQG